jgi:CheY-like chemotaxis protein
LAGALISCLATYRIAGIYDEEQAATFRDRLMLHLVGKGGPEQRLAQRQPELIVLDVQFPDADGRDILAELNADGTSRSDRADST